MDPLDFLEPEELLEFFHTRKTEMSCMENPQVFLNQLRDHNLIPEERYWKTIRMKSKSNIKKAVYEILDWLERETPKDIPLFWKCVFKDVIMNHYPTLKLMHNSLMDGSFHFPQLPEKVESEESDGQGSSKVSDSEETITNCAKNKRKLRSRSVCSDPDEEPGPSPKKTPGQAKKDKKIKFSSPKKGDMGEIWTWPIYKTQLPVTCGKVKGTLVRDKLAKGEECIVVGKQWFTPTEFEKFAEKGSYKNWKMSIRCGETTLGKLIKGDHLNAALYKTRRKMTKKSMLLAKQSNTASDEDDSEDEANPKTLPRTGEASEVGEQDEPKEKTPDHYKSTFKVTCGDLTGTLYKDRFGTGKFGKSIRTEMSWLSPIEFVNEALNQTDASWRKDILYNGNPLSVLVEARVLIIHSLLCECKLCRPKAKDLENEKNDDECSICKSKGDFVLCDTCPRSFHQECHLPRIDDTILSDDDQWICTFCVFKATEPWRYPDKQRTEDIMSSQISKHMQECQYLLLYLCSADEEQLFSTNPGQYLENYSSIIKAPMWLEEIANKLQRKEYKMVGQFVSDFHLIFKNVATYNKNNPEYFEMGKNLQQLFDSELKKAFNIQD